MSIKVVSFKTNPPKRKYRKPLKLVKWLYISALFLLAFLIQTALISQSFIDQIAAWDLDSILLSANLNINTSRTKPNGTENIPRDGSTVSNNIKFAPSNSSLHSFEEFIREKGYVYLSSLYKYIAWHRLMIQCLQSPTCPKKPRILLWNCPHLDPELCSGTGDRFRGIISMLAFAMLTNRLFLVDWPRYPVHFHHLVIPSSIDWRIPPNITHSDWPVLLDESFFKNGFFVWNKFPEDIAFDHEASLNESQSETVSNTTIYSARFAKRLWPRLDSIPNLSIFSRAPTTKWILRDPKWRKKYPDLCTDKVPERQIHRMLLQAMFKPSKVINATLQSLIHSDIRVGYLSIHARTGQDFGENKLSRFSKLLKNEEIAERLLNCASRQMGKIKMPIYFASDSTTLKKAVVNVSKTMGLQVYYSSIPGYHIVYGNGIKNETRQKDSEIISGYIGIFVDFFGLAGGRKVISNKSEFSRLAFTYGSTSNLILVNIVDKNINKTCI